jgi:hypothetical protein
MAGAVDRRTDVAVAIREQNALARRRLAPSRQTNRFLELEHPRYARAGEFVTMECLGEALEAREKVPRPVPVPRARHGLRV